MQNEVLVWADHDAECRAMKCKLLNSLCWDVVQHTFRRSEWLQRWRQWLEFCGMRYAMRSGKTARLEVRELAHKLTINAKDWALQHVKEIERMKSELLVWKKGVGVFAHSHIFGEFFADEAQLKLLGFIEQDESRMKLYDFKPNATNSVELVVKCDEGGYHGEIAGVDLGPLCDGLADLLHQNGYLHDKMRVWLTWEGAQ